jgi:1-acyl-sn-glycerol-3-phosphate acyltransferase
MQFISSILKFIWAVWGAFWFMVVVIIFTPLYAFIFAVFGRKYVMDCVWINCHYLAPFLLFMWGIRLKVYGRERLNPKGTYVYASNHLSQADTIVSAAALPQPIKFLAKSEIKYVPFFGYMTKMLAIMVDRKSKESRDKSMIYLVEELKKGNSVFLYPEGTRNRTGAPLKEFKDGAFKAAIMGQVPIVPLTLLGTLEANNPKGLQLKPGLVKAYFGEPINTKGMTLDNIEKLKEMVRGEMLKYLSEW